MGATLGPPGGPWPRILPEAPEEEPPSLFLPINPDATENTPGAAQSTCPNPRRCWRKVPSWGERPAGRDWREGTPGAEVVAGQEPRPRGRKEPENSKVPGRISLGPHTSSPIWPWEPPSADSYVTGTRCQLAACLSAHLFLRLALRWELFISPTSQRGKLRQRKTCLESPRQKSGGAGAGPKPRGPGAAILMALPSNLSGPRRAEVKGFKDLRDLTSEWKTDRFCHVYWPAGWSLGPGSSPGPNAC